MGFRAATAVRREKLVVAVTHRRGVGKQTADHLRHSYAMDQAAIKPATRRLDGLFGRILVAGNTISLFSLEHAVGLFRVLLRMG